ncbi:S-inosyl-L-homocysteine hydrolase [Alphaproteobacteria bacterium SO-S41]|nr:S-inosyl-L-homocysteine hydrolase [Alphaproteobacteria bacterium SO-S41]
MSLGSEHPKAFFARVAAEVGRLDMRLIVLNHSLPDLPDLLDAANAIAPISLFIPVPYSINAEVLPRIEQKFRVAKPKMEELLDHEALASVVRPYLQEGRTAILEVGGYFAPAMPRLKSEFGERILGFVEDTEAGHRRYVRAEPLVYPTLSVARSPVKQQEDSLVGPACTFSAERLLKSRGMYMHARRCLVIGYGKVGRGAAQSLAGRHNSVTVYDLNPIKRTVAMGDGFRIPEREQALAQADLIFGCTGATSLGAADFPLLKHGAILVSCSSKRHEFDLAALNRDYARTEIAPNIDRFDRGDQTLYLLAGGAPVNFLDGGVGGPALPLVQAEILMATAELLNTPRDRTTIAEIGEERRKRLADIWIDTFCDPRSGSYRA